MSESVTTFCRVSQGYAATNWIPPSRNDEKKTKKTKQNKRRTERIAVSILNCPRQKPMACDAVV